MTVAEFEAFVKSKADRGPEQRLDKLGSIVFDAKGTPGGTSEAQTDTAARQLRRAQRRRRKPDEPAAHDLHGHGRRPRPPRCPPRRRVEKTIEFGFRGPTTLKVGEVVRFENEGFLVHMDIAFPVKSKRAAQKGLRPSRQARKRRCSSWSPASRSASTARSPRGAFQQETITAEAGLVRPGLLHGHAGRPRRTPRWGWSAPSTSSSRGFPTARGARSTLCRAPWARKAAGRPDQSGRARPPTSTPGAEVRPEHRADLGAEQRLAAEDLAPRGDELLRRPAGAWACWTIQSLAPRSWSSREVVDHPLACARRCVRTRPTGAISVPKRQDRLDLQRGPDHGLRRADAPALAQVLERVEAEPDVQRLARLRARPARISSAVRPLARVGGERATRQPEAAGAGAAVDARSTRPRAGPPRRAAAAASRALSQVPDRPPAMWIETTSRPGLHERLVAGQEVADRWLGGGRQLRRLAAGARRRRRGPRSCALGRRSPVPADVEADLVDLPGARSARRGRYVVLSVTTATLGRGELIRAFVVSAGQSAHARDAPRGPREQRRCTRAGLSGSARPSASP